MRKFLLFWSVFLLCSMSIKGQGLFGEQEVFIDPLEGISLFCLDDLNNDGILDVLSTSSEITVGNYYFRWNQNYGNNNFSSPNTINTYANWILKIHTTDIDQDNDIDVIMASMIGNKRMEWFENDGIGTFDKKNIIHTNLFDVKSMVTTDLDNDNDIDIIAASFYDEKVMWLENNGNNKFENQWNISTELEGAHCIDIADIDGDGTKDLLLAPYWDNRIAWYKNDGQGNFGTPNIIANKKRSSIIYVEDINIDGHEDVVICLTQYDTEAIIWYENDGNGNFDNSTVVDSLGSIRSIHVEDLDVDGDRDILALINYDNSKDALAWYENRQNGSLWLKHIFQFESPSLYSIDIGDLDSDGDLDVFYPLRDKLVWHRNLTVHNSILAFTFQDTNENAEYDSEEKSLANQKLLLSPLSCENSTNNQGYAFFFINEGDYQLTHQPNPLWKLTTTPETYNITVTDDTELPTYYFGFKPARILPRVEPHLNSSPTRCSTQSTYWLHYSNTGTTIANGTITLEIDGLMDFVSSNPTPDAIEGRKLIWHFEDLYPSFENKIEIQFQMPDFNSIGEILETQASLQLFNENEELVYSKSTDYNSEVLCSYDPNDKLVRSNLLGQSETAYISDTLLYTIRFQNTGNDVAFNIRIEDVLDKRLDWTTFHPITASHDYRTELNRETGLVTFFFDDIMLPDSTTNEPESHGFVLFGIASLPDIGDKTEIENTASIFFDFNPPIVTNTVSTVMIELDDVSIEGGALVRNERKIAVYPNPFSDYTTIEVEGLPEGEYELEVMDILGRKVQSLTLENGKAKLERGKLENGVYLWRILEEGSLQEIGTGKVLIE